MEQLEVDGTTIQYLDSIKEVVQNYYNDLFLRKKTTTKIYAWNFFWDW